MDSQDWKLKKNGSSNSAAKIKAIRCSGERKTVQRDVARHPHRIDDSEAEQGGQKRRTETILQLHPSKAIGQRKCADYAETATDSHEIRTLPVSSARKCEDT